MHPLPHVIFATKKDTWQKTVLRQKHVLNATLKDTWQSFVKMILKYKLVVEETFEQNVVMLYDPDSEYSIISKSMYGKLSVKPPLLPLKQCGVGIHNSKFQFHGVICVNLQFTNPDNSFYDLQ